MTILVIKFSESAVEALTNDVDGATNDNGPLATNDVGDITSNKSTEESTSGQDRDNERGVAGADGTARGRKTLGADGTLNLLDEERGVENTVDVTRVVSGRRQSARVTTWRRTSCLPKEDTTEGGEGAEQVGLPCDRRLSHVDIGGGLERLLAASLRLVEGLLVVHVGG